MELGLRELGMLDNYYIDHKTCNIIILFLTKSNSAAEVGTTPYN